MRQNVIDDPMPAIMIATAGGAVVAVGMMFVPFAVLEWLIGLTGLSAFFPAAFWPLDGFARAMIAYATGAAALGGLAVFLLRGDCPDDDLRKPRETVATTIEYYRGEILKYISGRWPWHKVDEDIRSLSDLTRFRSVNLDDDAPPRRPLVASQDLPAIGLVAQPSVVAPVLTEHGGEPEHIATQNINPTQSFAVPPTFEPASTAAPEMSTADMVAQLETAAAMRYQRRALHAANMSGKPTQERDDNPDNDAALPVRDVAHNQSYRPLLELVSSGAEIDDGADSALAAALATLHRMTAIAR